MCNTWFLFSGRRILAEKGRICNKSWWKCVGRFLLILRFSGSWNPKFDKLFPKISFKLTMENLSEFSNKTFSVLMKSTGFHHPQVWKFSDWLNTQFHWSMRRMKPYRKGHNFASVTYFYKNRFPIDFNWVDDAAIFTNSNRNKNDRVFIERGTQLKI